MKKIVFIGTNGVGKTSIIKHYILDIPFGDNTDATIGAAYHEITKYSNNNNTKRVAIWDTAGQERYKALAPIYYKGCQTCICVFDLGNRASFDACEEWLNTFIKHSGCEDPFILLIANKADTLVWKVTDGEISTLCKIYECEFMYTCCLNMKNKNEFDDIMYNVCQRKQVIEQNITLGDTLLPETQTIPTSICCWI